MDAKTEITAAIERVRNTGQKEFPKTRPFEHDAVFNMIMSSVRKTSDNSKALRCYPIPRTSAQENELAEEGYWGENWQWIDRSRSKKGLVDIARIVGRLTEVSNRLADLEYRLEVHMNTLDDLAHRM